MSAGDGCLFVGGRAGGLPAHTVAVDGGAADGQVTWLMGFGGFSDWPGCRVLMVAGCRVLMVAGSRALMVAGSRVRLCAGRVRTARNPHSFRGETRAYARATRYGRVQKDGNSLIYGGFGDSDCDRWLIYGMENEISRV